VNLILERPNVVPYFTEMRSVFTALGILPSDYDWYISDIETNYYGSSFSSDDQWIDGHSLERFIGENTVQFIWAVFSAFSKGTRFVVDRPPTIEDNPRYWSGSEITPQLSGAAFEIACWDSSATILIGLPVDAERRFKARYPDACSLISAAR